MIKWIKRWWCARQDKKFLNSGSAPRYVTIVIPKADFKYPPPSAYEVKQIAIEYDLFYTSQNCNDNMDKELTNGN